MFYFKGIEKAQVTTKEGLPAKYFEHCKYRKELGNSANRIILCEPGTLAN